PLRRCPCVISVEVTPSHLPVRGPRAGVAAETVTNEKRQRGRYQPSVLVIGSPPLFDHFVRSGSNVTSPSLPFGFEADDTAAQTAPKNPPATQSNSPSDKSRSAFILRS